MAETYEGGRATAAKRERVRQPCARVDGRAAVGRVRLKEKKDKKGYGVRGKRRPRENVKVREKGS